MNNIEATKLNKLMDTIHNSAMEYIEIISRSGITKMNELGKEVNPDTLQTFEVAEYAALSLGLPVEETVANYIELLLFEELIEIVK